MSNERRILKSPTRVYLKLEINGAVDEARGFSYRFRWNSLTPDKALSKFIEVIRPHINNGKATYHDEFHIGKSSPFAYPMIQHIECDAEPAPARTVTEVMNYVGSHECVTYLKKGGDN